MKKTHSNAAWNKLTEAQRAKLEHWLFDKRFSYEKTHALAQKQLGYQGSVSSVRRFREHAAQERTVAGIIQGRQTADAIQKTDVHVSELSDAGMKVVAQLFLHHVTTQPEKAREWTFLAKLLLRHEADRNREALKHEQNRIRQTQADLARQKWFDHLNERNRIAIEEQQLADEQVVNEHLASQRKDTPGYAFNRWSNRMRFKIYHKHIPDDELLPENEADDAAFKAAAALPKGTPDEERHRIAAETYRQIKERLAQQAEAE